MRHSLDPDSNKKERKKILGKTSYFIGMPNIITIQPIQNYLINSVGTNKYLRTL